MKVLMLSWEYPPHSVGGLGKHVQELIPALSRLGVDVHLVTHRGSGGATRETIIDGDARAGGSGRVTVHRADPPPNEPGSFFSAAQRMNASFEAVGRAVWEEFGPFDLIHAHDWLVGFAAISLKHAFKAPLLTTIHATEFGRCRGVLGNDLSRAINHAEWVLVYESWRVICCSHFMAGEINLALGTPTDKVDVVPNGVDPSRFDDLAGEDLREFRLRFAAANEAIVFYVGRVVHEKGVHLLVRAMKLIRSQSMMAKLVVAGTGDSLDTLRQLAVSLDVSAHCYFAGFVPDGVRDRLYRVADVAAFPSLYEPFGIVALEAMAAHTPVVASAVGGLREVLRHGENGITVYPNDVDSLAWGILHTLNAPVWTMQRVETAYRMVVEEFNWDIIANTTHSIYDRVVDERREALWT